MVEIFHKIFFHCSLLENRVKFNEIFLETQTADTIRMAASILGGWFKICSSQVSIALSLNAISVHLFPIFRGKKYEKFRTRVKRNTRETPNTYSRLAAISAISALLKSPLSYL